jgi:carbonic anhydrase
MCGSREPPVYVHGHSQCSACKVNIDPCCGGAPLDGLAA